MSKNTPPVSFSGDDTVIDLPASKWDEKAWEWEQNAVMFFRLKEKSGYSRSR
jgi:hypothetical protein